MYYLPLFNQLFFDLPHQILPPAIPTTLYRFYFVADSVPDLMHLIVDLVQLPLVSEVGVDEPFVALFELEVDLLLEDEGRLHLEHLTLFAQDVVHTFLDISLLLINGGYKFLVMF
jgi:hypothetical protein